MTHGPTRTGTARNIALYPWFKFFQNLIFWQAVWFLYFQSSLSAAEALLLYVIYDITTTALEVPSGYMSDAVGRKPTLVAAMLAGMTGMGVLILADSFVFFALGQVFIGVGAAFASGTDSALLYESLAAEDRADEVETHTTRAWQCTLAALALSALTGGLMAGIAFELAFGAAALALGVAAMLSLTFVEPPHATAPPGSHGLRGQVGILRDALRLPVLAWLFVLSVLMYGFSHVPFVFGQPFIEETLRAIDWQSDAPAISGGVSATMMLVSVAASLVALRMRRALGLPALLMLAFGMQIALIAVLAVTQSVAAIAVLLLRMVPDSWSHPFIEARIQPLLNDQGRATFLSLQSFVGRLLFAASLYAASLVAPQSEAAGYAGVQTTLGWYALAGLVFFLGLLTFLSKARIEPGS